MIHWFRPPQGRNEDRKAMSRNSPNDSDPESAIIDADLLVKYRMVNRAIETLERAIDSAPRHIGLREKLREILIDAGRRDQAAQHCLALASLHISAGDVESANERLLEAKRLDPRVSVTGQLRDVRQTESAPPQRTQKILSGSLADVNLFDIIQIIENSRLTGLLQVTSSAVCGEIHFDEGLVIGAKSGMDFGRKALSLFAGAGDGSFEFEKTSGAYDRTIQTTSNTALILDMLRIKDEEDHGLGRLDTLQ
jgi:tetratricopeptide (TPR) repeat protein